MIHINYRKKEQAVKKLLYWANNLGVIHIWRRPWGERGRQGKKWGFIGRKGWGVSECSRRSIFTFFLKKNWICAMTRHHAEPNINVLLTRNLPFDSHVRQWSHPWMKQLHCLWAKLNNRTRGRLECDLTWFCFCFDFLCPYARCSSCSIVCLRFQIV